MRQADGAEVVGDLGLFQRAAVQRDGARLVAARRGETAVQPPEIRQNGRRDDFAQRVRRASERRARLRQIVLQEPCFRQDGTKRELVGPRQRGRAEGLLKDLGSLGAAPALECRLCTGHHPLKRDAQHERQYTPRALKLRRWLR